jgi:hypothetical protein
MIIESLFPALCVNSILLADVPSLILKSPKPPPMMAELLNLRAVWLLSWTLSLMTVRPPFTLIVDAFRVEGIAPPPPPGGYAALLMLLTMKELIVPLRDCNVLVLIVLVLKAFVVIGAEPMFVRPPLKVIVDACMVEGMLPPPGVYGAPLMLVRLILAVLI